MLRKRYTESVETEKRFERFKYKEYEVKHMARISDVAKRAGVSETTVSRFLNGTGYVSKESAEKIDQAIKVLNFIPNERARNLYFNKGNIVALIIPSVSHPFFGILTRYIEMELSRFGYKMMLCTLTSDEVNNEHEYLEMLRRQIVDGIITGVHSLDESIYSMLDGPIVAFDKTLHEDIPVVHANHAQGGQFGGELLVKSGCRHVVQILGSTKVKTPAQIHSQVCATVLKENGVKIDFLDTGVGLMEEYIVRQTAEKVFELYPEVDGIYAADMYALACLRLASERGIRVPEDLSIVAYDGTYVTEFCHPVLTAIVQPLEEIARELVCVLMKEIRGEVIEKKKIILDMKLRMGGTTKE